MEKGTYKNKDMKKTTDLKGNTILADDPSESMGWEGDKIICRKTMTETHKP